MKSITFSLLTLIVGATTSVHALNLFVNGDFSSGNTAFTTGYAYSPGNLIKHTAYDVVANPHNDNTYAASFGDHSGSGGLMLCVNDSDNYSGIAWSQTVNVSPNIQYQLSAWAASWAYYMQPIDPSPALLHITINGVQLGSDTQLPAADGQWANFGGTWNSGSATQAIVSFYDVNTNSAGGNDFSLDDLSFQAVPEPSSVALLGLAAGAMAICGRRNR
jgi:hypothetical protein